MIAVIPFLILEETTEKLFMFIVPSIIKIWHGSQMNKY
jgi:hypothetical protein